MRRFNILPVSFRRIAWSHSIGLGVLMLVMLWSGIGAKYIGDRANDLDGSKRDMQNFALLFEENVLRSIGEMDKALLYLRRTIEMTGNRPDFQNIVGTSDILSELIVQVAIIDAQGIMRASNIGPQPAPATDLSDREHFRFHVGNVKDELYISKPLVGRASRKWSVQLTRRFQTPDGSFGGVVVASFNPDHFAKFYGRIDLGKGASFALIGADGIVRASGGNETMRLKLGQDLGGSTLMNHIGTGHNGAFIPEVSSSGTAGVITVRAVAGHSLAVSVGMPMQFIFEGSAANLRLTAFAGVVLSLMIAATTWQARKSEQEVQWKSRQLQLTLEHMSQGIMMVTKDRAIPIMNRKCLELLDLPPHFILEPPNFDELADYQEQQGEFASMHIPAHLKAVDVIGPNNAMGQFDMYERTRPDGTVLEVRSAWLADGGFVRTITDITRRREAQSRADRLASEDVLTGLSNRRVLGQTLDSLAVAPHGEADLEVHRHAILCLDLDRFKRVNDTHGHAVGDRLLQAVASRIRQSVRLTDVVARMGGDEFAVVLASAHQEPRPEVVAQRLVETLGQPYLIDGQKIVIGTSIGIAVGPMDGQTANELLIAADLALYAAKAGGRGTFRFFTKEMNEEVKGRQQVETDLRDAIANDKLELHYQPIVRLSDGAVDGFEALARWTHPVHGRIAPDKFIPVAEESGLIVMLGAWALREGCRQAATWPEDISLAVNLSPLQFESPDLAAMIEAVLEEAGLAPSRLELEITEGLLMRNTQSTIETLHSLKKLGIRIAMDDFGTGYSSLSYLQSFPFDRIKIDRTFVSELGTNTSSSVVVQAVVDIAKSRGIKTTAEGVETEAQRKCLSELGCNDAQGYLFGRPVPLADVGSTIWNCKSRSSMAA